MKRQIQTSYAEKLKDPKWQKLRLQVLERDKWTCQCCGDTERTLNIHHLKYCGEPWETPLEKLETLCEKCHSDRERTNKMIIDDVRSFKTKDFLNSHGRLIFDTIQFAFNPGNGIPSYLLKTMSDVIDNAEGKESEGEP